jgi:hypothetical protein
MLIYNGLSRVGEFLRISNTADNRTEPRFETEIRVKAKSIHGETWSKGKIINLSRCGACLEGKIEWKMGSVVEIVTYLRSDKVRAYSLLGHVTWTKGKMSGIRFLIRP